MNTMTINGQQVQYEQETNVLEVIRRAGIDLPTFCYHSELSVYGACRMCMVDVDKRGALASCHTPPEPGMVIKTNTPELRHMRKISLELLLANHDRECTACSRSGSCKLQELAQRFGIQQIRFGQRDKRTPLDHSSPSIVRDPNKCILCGDCVRMCEEVQGIGVLDFAHRGSKITVSPAFNKQLGDVECVNCGQCAAICPTCALIVKCQTEQAWRAIHDPKTTVVVQIAPAIRVAMGEEFNLPPGQSTLGQIAAALRLMGVDYVFDTSFTADLTVLEETHELVDRLEQQGPLPHFTSCCPAWVKFVEQYYPEFLPNLSSCRSPQQMFGSLAKYRFSQDLGLSPDNMFVISIMPCTAKKFEAQRDEFQPGGRPDVDLVLTTQELAKMIREDGMDFANLEPSSLDMPFGFVTGAGVIFGASGGVSEAVLRHAFMELTGKPPQAQDLAVVRSTEGQRVTDVQLGDTVLRLAVAHGLAEARDLLEKIKAGEEQIDVLEVMACPGGCVGGAGQPISQQRAQAVAKRTSALHREDKALQLHQSAQNPMVKDVYQRWLEKPGSDAAHALLHTHYGSRRRIAGSAMEMGYAPQAPVDVQVCVGTSCYLKGSMQVLKALTDQVSQAGLTDNVRLRGAFCCQQCASGPMVIVGDDVVAGVSPQDIPDLMHRIRQQMDVPASR